MATNKTNNKYTKEYVQKTFVDALEEDGALCDYYSKYYLEDETLKGGVGNRLTFKKYNDRITQFHHILRILTGESRANIYEALPAIDFLSPQNTSFLNTYPQTSGGINPKEIVAIEASKGEDALYLLEKEDKYTINRALAGLPTAEHFYNTTDLVSSEYSLQVSPYQGTCDYIYQGVVTPRSMHKGVVSSKVRKSKLMYFKATAPTVVYFNESVPNIDPEPKGVDDKVAYFDKIENTLTGNLEATEYMILNSDCGWSPAGMENKENLYTPIKHEGIPIVEATDPKYRDYIGHYTLNLDANDLLIAIPKDSYTIGCSKILLLKYNDSVVPSIRKKEATIVYYRKETGKFYTDAGFTELLVPEAGKFYVDGNFKPSDDYYLYDAVNSIYVKSAKNDFEEQIVYFSDDKLTAYSDIALTQVVTPNNRTLYKDGLACTQVAYSYNPDTMILSIDRGVVLETRRVLRFSYTFPFPFFRFEDVLYAEYTVTPSEYTCYVLYIDSFDSGFSLSSGFSEIEVGESLNSLANNKCVLDILKKYLSIEKNYVANASGLLDGFFCEPVEYKDTMTSRKVTKWKFINDVSKALKNGMSIDVGSKYYEGHLLGRGNLMEAPLKLTPHDNASGTSYKGKFELIYDKLLDFNIRDFIKDRAEDSSWTSISNIPYLYKVTSVVTKFNYIDGTKIKDSSKKDLGGSINKIDMYYPKKFYIDDESLIDINNIDLYIDYFDKAFNESTHTLYLDLQDTENIASSYRFLRNDEGSCGSEGSPEHKEGQDYGNDTQNRALLKEKYSTCFRVSYDVHVKKDGKTYVDAFENLSISMITPRELFRTSQYVPKGVLQFNPFKDYLESLTKISKSASSEDVGSINDVTVVFPEYNKYFPEYAYVFSRFDLGLQPFDSYANSKNTCSFLSEDGKKILMFKVDKVTKILPSQVWKVEIYDPKTGVRSTKPIQGIDRYLIEGYSSRSKYVLSEDTSMVEYKKYFTVDEEDRGYREVRYRANKNPKSLGLYELAIGDERDCYIYKLSYFDVPVTQGLNLYDWEDKELQIKDMNLPGKIVGLSCDLDGSGYFELNEKVEDGVKVYEVPESHRVSDFDTLKNSYILGGIPSKGNYSYGNFSVSTGGSRLDLRVLDSLFAQDTVTASKALRNILFDWHLSDSSLNPIVMSDLPELLKGLIDCKQDLVNLGQVGFTIRVKGIPVTLTEESFRNFISIMDTNREVKFYNLDIGYSESVISSLMDSLQLYPIEDGRYILKKNNDGYTGVTYTPNQLIANGVSIPKIYQAIIQKVIYDSLYINGIDTPSKISTRKSLTTIYNQVKGIFDGTRTLDKDVCKELDGLFGNDTFAFLNIGNQYEVDGRLITYTSQMDIAQSKLTDSIVGLVTDTINTMYNRKSEITRNNALNEVRNIFKQYFTESSVDSNVYLTTSGIFVNYFGLDINTRTNASRGIFNIIKSKYDPYSSQNIIIRLFSRLFNRKSIWSQYDLDSFISTFYENATGLNTLTRIKIFYHFLSETSSVTSSAISRFNERVKTCQVSKASVNSIMMSGNVGESDNSIYLADYVNIGDADSIEVASTTNNRIAVKVTPPSISDTIVDGAVTSISLNKGSDRFIAKHFNNVFDDNIDITENVMWGLVEYIKTNLEGTNPNNENNPYYIRYVEGEDTELVGRPNSLYYKRYQMLNNRMNRLTGPLWKASSTLRNTKILDTLSTIKDQTVISYDPYLEVMPIASMDSLVYMPTKEAALSSDVLKGKFYSQEEIDALRKQISSKCVLTCTKCTIQDTCPFYDKEEIIKQYCSGIESIDIWVKDNELDLIYHDEDDASPTLISDDTKEGINLNKLKLIHKPYSEINRRFGVSEVINDLEDVRTQLAENSSLKYEDFVRDDMGWLLGARYGTVQKNSMKDLLVNNAEYSTLVDKIHPYSYMYDALFIEDEESYVMYSPSKHRYNVEFEMGKPGQKRHYKGNTKLKIPSSLKILFENKGEDDVYLISDDTVDSNGEPILPLIYLGKIKNLSYVFDLTDDGIEGGVTDPLDKKLYANDVAQWCMNYYKGNLYEYPIGESSGGITDSYRDKDQYWMEKVYKQIDDRWYTFSGRKREHSGYCAPLIDVNEFDDILAVSGRPMVANYINFLRKVSIRMYDRDTQEWLIPWVNENLSIKNMKKYFKGFNGDLEKMKEKQRCTLPLMKTNLRLVVVKN